jgi:hypothetical protein
MATPAIDDVPKKRGRKKKVAEPSLDADGNPLPVDEAAAAEKPKSRRGRKTKAVVGAYELDQHNTSLSDDENIIVKLQVGRGGDNQEDGNREMQGIECAGLDCVGDAHGNTDINVGVHPNAYNAHNSFESVPLDLTGAEASGEASRPGTEDPKHLKVVDLLQEFQKKSHMCEWPQNTSISCYWCCHQFATVPYGIPIKYHHGKFYVYGCFCSLECAASHNFNSHESSDEVWERYNLINLLSRQLNYKPVVKFAPSKLSLKIFGGHLSIEEFRAYFDSNKILSENFPPMMTLTQQIEEINECDINSEYRYIPIDHERINKYKEKLTLKRTKPLTNYKHTLDHMMNLKIQE